MSREIRASLWQSNTDSVGDWKRLITRGRQNRKLEEAKRSWPVEDIRETEAWLLAARYDNGIPRDWDEF